MNGCSSTLSVAAKACPSRRTEQPINWPVLVSFTLMYIGAALAPFHFSWSSLGIAVVLYCVTGMAITLGYHRLLTHRSFQTFDWLRNVIAYFGCMAFIGGPLTWAEIHRLHHQHSDEEEYPHRPHDGFLWSHVLYAFRLDPDSHRALNYVKDLRLSGVLTWLEKWSFVPQLSSFVALYILGELVSPAPWGSGLGLSWLLWGGFVRTVVMLNAAGLVNSVTHIVGYRNFETKDNSRNLWWVALITFGEGWHNNHHAQQRSAAHGMLWWELDPTFWAIRLLSAFGSAWNIVEPIVPDRLPRVT